MTQPSKKGLLLLTQVMDQEHQVLGFFVSWVRQLASFGNPITVVCWAKGRCDDLPPNVEILVLPKGKWLRWFRLWKLSFVRRHEFGTAFVHMIPPVAAALGWWWRLLGFRVVLWYTHGYVPFSLRITECFAHRLLTATDESLRLETSKKRVTGHGIDLTLYHPVAGIQRKAILLSAGRISARKDQMSLLLAANLIHQRWPSLVFQVVIVGEPCTPEDETYLQTLKQFVKDHALEQIVRWEGKKTGAELLTAYSKAAVFVSTSNTGSLDKVVLEAMACETPVLATNAAFAHLTSVQMVDSLTSETGLAFLKEKLEQPQAFPAARAEVERVADLRSLMRTVHAELFPN
jgi:glycosyltransferase involved in cell wall biosynthesis